MYEFLKMLQGVAEQMGAVRSISMSDKDEIFGSQVRIEGVALDGSAFRLKLDFETKKEGTDDRN